jgi:hypothetical protein
MALRVKKSTRRRRQTRKSSRKLRRRQRGGGNTYTFTVATPITNTSIARGFPAELGTFSASNQSITFSNPTKTITDIQIGSSTSPTSPVSQYKTASTYTPSSGTKVSIKIGDKQSLVPNGVSVRGTTALPGASAAAAATVSGAATPYKGLVTINGLTTSSFGTLPSLLSFTVLTSD